jgi:hypothetical protein
MALLTIRSPLGRTLRSWEDGKDRCRRVASRDAT